LKKRTKELLRVWAERARIRSARCAKVFCFFFFKKEVLSSQRPKGDKLETCDCLLREDLPEAALPGALSRLLVQLRRRGCSCADVAGALASAWALPASHAEAAIRLGREADGSGLSNGYHNPGHTRDVTVLWANLAWLNNRLAQAGRTAVALERPDIAVGIFAALGHDLLHDGIGNIVLRPAPEAGEVQQPLRIPFRLERIAADHASGLLQDCGVGGDLIAPVAAAILTTDPVDGFAALRNAAAGHAFPPDCAALLSLRRPAWQCVASMLRDADLLASVGLSAVEHDRQSALLAEEIGVDVNTPEQVEKLFETAAAERLRSPAGALFMPQFQALRSLNRVRCHKGGWLSLEAAARRLAGS
jgi:hypothetical protein